MNVFFFFIFFSSTLKAKEIKKKIGIQTSRASILKIFSSSSYRSHFYINRDASLGFSFRVSSLSSQFFNASPKITQQQFLFFSFIKNCESSVNMDKYMYENSVPENLITF